MKGKYQLIYGLLIVAMLFSAGCASADQPSPVEGDSPGWNLSMKGACEDEISQACYEDSVNCYHAAQWKDEQGNVWMGMTLWILVSDVDDIESGHPSFNESLAEKGYTINVISADGSSRSFESGDIARNRGYIVANTLNGEPLSGDDAPLKLVGAEVSASDSIGGITSIELQGF